MQKLTDRYGPALTQRALRYLEIQLKAQPDTQAMEPAIRAQRDAVVQRQDALDALEEERMGVSARIAHLDAEVDALVLQLSRHVLALVAGSASVARNRQIRIEYFADSGSEKRQRALARFGALMVFVLFALIAVLSVRVVWDDFRFGETSPGIGVPQWWYTIWLPVLSVAIAGRALGLFIRRGRQP